MKTEDKIIEEIAKKIDPNNTFLNQCEEIVNERFGLDKQKELEKTEIKCFYCKKEIKNGGYIKTIMGNYHINCYNNSR